MTYFPMTNMNGTVILNISN